MIPSGLTISAARWCSTEVSMTVPCRPSSIPWAISSSPGASGILRSLDGLGRSLDRLGGRLAGLEAGPLLGALRVVAAAPAEGGLAPGQPPEPVGAGPH